MMPSPAASSLKLRPQLSARLLRWLALWGGATALVLASGCQSRDLSLGQKTGGGGGGIRANPTGGTAAGGGSSGATGGTGTAGATTIATGGTAAGGGGSFAAGGTGVAGTTATGGTAAATGGAGGTMGATATGGAAAATGGAGGGIGSGTGGTRPLSGAPVFTPVSPGSDLSTLSTYRLLSDVNGDGKLDLIATTAPDTTSNSGGVNVLLGRGNGTFATAVKYAVASASAVAVGDLNGDGKPDLAVSTGLPNATILLNKGDGTYAAPVVSSQPGTGGGGIQLADLNGDGKADLVTRASPAGVNVFLNIGDGTFGPGVPYSAPFFDILRVSFGLGDLNGDGKVDLVLSVDHREAMGVLLNTGDGTFGAATPLAYVTGPVPIWIGITDMNGDGKADIVGVGSVNGGVSVFLNSGAGAFAPPLARNTLTSLPTNMNGLVADFNGDGTVDLVIPNVASAASGIGSLLLLNNGDGSLVSSSTVLPPYMAAVGDLNGDGKPDLVALDQVLLNTSP